MAKFDQETGVRLDPEDAPSVAKAEITEPQKGEPNEPAKAEITEPSKKKDK